MYKKIHIDQCGYLPDMIKKVTFVSDKEVPFSVLASDGRCVYEGLASKRIDNPASGEVVYTGDFSDVKEPGRYYIVSDSAGESDTFTIGEDAYADVFQKAMKFFYLQRCGCDLPESHAGIFAHKACHTGMASVYGKDNKIEVSGGWHDAGDYGRYIGPAAMTIVQLLMAQEANPTLAGTYQNDLGDVLPPYLAEIKYEIDWMLKLQREDGKVYHKATCYQFCGFIMPEEETEEIVLSPVSLTATADFAAAMAYAIRFYEPYDKEYAKTLETAAKKAYAALAGYEEPGGFKNPDGITTGEYGDTCTTDELYWAAAEMYRTFGDACYHEDFKKLASEKIWHGYGWADMGSYGNLAYLNTTYETEEALKEKIKASMIELADKRLAIVREDGYNTALAVDEYVWGSNLYTLANGIHLYDAYQLTKETKYLEAALDQIHYVLGRNPMGMCYVSGCGTRAILHPHHRPSGFLGKAMPGMLSGGPCIWRADATIRGALPQDTAPAKCLCDMTGSYSSNEVTIYWNSAFLLLLAQTCRDTEGLTF